MRLLICDHHVIQVANFSNTEDDATFWSRLIPADAAMQAEVRFRALLYSESFAVSFYTLLFTLFIIN
jgi:hypothetical protein